MKTEFEKLVDEDRQVMMIRKQRDIKTHALENNSLSKLTQLRKGTPQPVLSLGKQIQNTGREVSKQMDSDEKLLLQIKRQAEKEIRKREQELADQNKEIYKEHTLQKSREQQKENQKFLDRKKEKRNVTSSSRQLYLQVRTRQLKSSMKGFGTFV